jgi:hypothetical protein
MAADFPTSVKTFTTKANDVDTIDASHINDLQDEVTAIETVLKGTVAVPATRVTTWTPTFAPTGGAFTSITYASQVGYQMRMAGVVFIQGSISLSAINTTGASGNIRISGLPVAGVANGAAISISQAQNWTTAAPAAGRTLGSQIQLFTNTNFAELPVANITATSNLVFTLFYFYTAT